MTGFDGYGAETGPETGADAADGSEVGVVSPPQSERATFAGRAQPHTRRFLSFFLEKPARRDRGANRGL